MGIKERKQREKRRRSNAILNAAKRIIWDKGVEGLTMSQVAELTELNKATLYSYFSNKDDLIDAIVYDGLVLLDEDLQERERQSRSGLEEMMDLARATLDFYREYPVYFYALNHQERRASRSERETPFSVKGNEVAARIFGRVRQGVERGIDDGSIRSEIETDSFLVLFFAFTYGVMHTVISKQDVYADVLGLGPEEVERSGLEFLEHFLKRGGSR